MVTTLITLLLCSAGFSTATVDTVLVSETPAGRWEKVTLGRTDRSDVQSVKQDRAGNLWLMLQDHVVRITDGVETRIDTSAGLHPGSYTTFAESVDGRQWIAGTHHGRLAVSWNDGDGWTYEVSETEGTPGHRSTVDQAGRLWITGRNPNIFLDEGGPGVYRYDGRLWVNLKESNGLAHDRAYDVVTHPDGSVWVATLRGISRLSGETWTHYREGTTDEDILHRKTYRLMVDTRDWMWAMHGYKGLSVFDGDAWHHLTAESGMVVSRARVAAELPDGIQWFGIHPHDESDEARQGVLRRDGGKWTLLSILDGLPEPGVGGLIARPDGTLLIVTAESAIRFTPTPERMASVSGHVYRNGKPASGVVVHAEAAAGGERAGTMTGPDGRFELSVVPGTYTIASPRSIGGDAPSVTVGSGERATGIRVAPMFYWSEQQSLLVIGLVGTVAILALLGLPIYFVVRWISRRPLLEDDDADPYAQPLRLTFHGTGGALFGITIVNIFLSIVTLGIYYFWGKARVRAYVYSQTALAGERFANHMTGRELLIGWIKAVAFILILTGLTEIPSFFWETQRQEVLTTAAFYLLLIFGFLPFAIVGSWRFRASRSEWRGIRFSSDASGRRFFWTYLLGSLATIGTLGLYSPYFETEIRGYLTKHTRYGTGTFEFDGRGGDLFKYYLLAYLLTPLTLGIYWFWYEARKTRYFWSRTTFAGAGFKSTVTGSKLMSLKVGNALLLIFTLGLAQPWVTVRNSRFFCEYLVMTSTPDWDAVIQDYDAATATGEGLSDYLDFEFEF